MDEQIKKTIGENLKRFREEKGYTQTDIAIYLGSTKSTVATWEQGRSTPDIETAHRLLLYYNRSIDDLFNKTKTPL